MLERELRLPDRELRVHGVRGHRRLTAEAGRERKDDVTRLLRQTSLTRERLMRRVAGREPDQPPRSFLRDPEAATLPARERRDRQVAVTGEEWRQIAAEIGVAEQDRPGRRGALGQRQRLPLPAVREPEDPGAGCRSDLGGRVAGPVVGDDHLRVRKLPLQLSDCLPDPWFLVPCRDQDR